MNLEKIHDDSFRNKELVQEAKVIGCFYCLEEFTPKDIKDYVSTDDTVVCPFCSIDSVIPLDEYHTHRDKREVLHAMNKEFFQKSVPFSEVFKN